MAAIRLLLFDLGGVLIDARHDMASLLDGSMTAEQINERMQENQPFLDYERGLLTPEDFAEAMTIDWRLTCTPADFLQNFATWTRGLYPGAIDLLAELRPRYRLAALSNSNLTHWERNNDILGVGGLFERAFSSHEFGHAKPDHRFYLHALAELGVEPQETVFFDDRRENVRAANELGMTAHQVFGIDELRAAILKAGLI